jgi:hypothetical protein
MYAMLFSMARQGVVGPVRQWVLMVVAVWLAGSGLIACQAGGDTALPEVYRPTPGNQTHSPAISVEFLSPATYTDVGVSRGVRTADPRHVMDQLAAYLVEQGRRCLVPGAILQVRVTDVRIAGDVEWWPRGGANTELRVLRDVTWPTMDLEFTVRDASGQQLKSGVDHLALPGYLQAVDAATTGLDQFPYEKHMIGVWYERRFCDGAPAPAK